MASTRDDISGRVSVGRRIADLCRPVVHVQLFSVLYFVCMTMQSVRRNSEASWIIFGCASQLQVPEASGIRQRQSSRFDQPPPTPAVVTGLGSMRSLSSAHAEKLKRGPVEDSGPESQVEANETAPWQSPAVGALPYVTNHTAAVDTGGNMHYDAENTYWIRKRLSHSGNSDREKPADEQAFGVLQRHLSAIHTPLNLPASSSPALSELERQHERSQFVHLLEGTMQHGQQTARTQELPHRSATNSAPLFPKRWRSSQNDRSQVAEITQPNEPWENFMSQAPAKESSAGLQNFRGRLLETINLPCSSLPDLPLQRTTAFGEACSFLCQSACANAADRRQSTATQSSASSALQFKKAIQGFLRASASQQPKLLEHACQNAFQQLRQQRGIEHLLPFGDGILGLHSGAAFASSSLSSLTYSASSTQVSPAGDVQGTYLLPVEVTPSVSFPTLSTEAGEPQLMVTPSGRPSTAVAPAVFSDNDVDSRSTGSTVDTGSTPTSSEYFANESTNFPPTEAVATDASPELLFSPELLENTDPSEASSATRSLSSIAERHVSRQHPKADEKADASLPMRRSLQQGLFWQQFIPSGISFDSIRPRTHSSGNLETNVTSALFPRSRISWSTEDGARDGLPRPVKEGQLRYAPVSSEESEGRRNQQQQGRGADRLENLNPNQLTTSELESVRAQLTKALYEVLQHLIENPTELRSQLEEERRKQGHPVLKAHQGDEQKRSSTPTESKDSKAQMLEEGNSENTSSAASGADGQQRGA